MYFLVSQIVEPIVTKVGPSVLLEHCVEKVFVISHELLYLVRGRHDFMLENASV